ncbi:hypothetical protein J6590_076653 [Homalodisca vitripennis]|nr:hypothetical protein J6590_076653 [Homalodisca vitripennis]
MVTSHSLCACVAGDVSLVSVQWLSSLQYAAVYCTQNSGTGPNLVIVNTPRNQPITYINYEDITYSKGDSLCAFVAGDVSLVSVQWLSSLQYAAVYCTQNSGIGPNLVIVNTPRNQPITYINYEDITYCNGDSLCAFVAGDVSLVSVQWLSSLQCAAVYCTQNSGTGPNLVIVNTPRNQPITYINYEDITYSNGDSLCAFVAGDVSLVSVQWLSSLQYAAVYCTQNSGTGPNLVIVNTPRNQPITYINYEDITYSNGDSLCAFVAGDVSLVSVQWLSSLQYAAVYCTQNSGTGPNLVIVNTPRNQPITYINYEDITYSNGDSRLTQFYFIHQQTWNVLLVGSANSMEVGVLGLQGEWEQWQLEDAARAELPLSPSKQETHPVGMAMDTSVQYNLPWGENQHLPPMPLLLVLSHEGVLTLYWTVNLLSAATVCVPPNPLPDTSGLQLVTSQPVTSQPAISQPAILQPAISQQPQRFGSATPYAADALRRKQCLVRSHFPPFSNITHPSLVITGLFWLS